MSVASGNKTQLAFAQETAYGTLPNANATVLGFVSESLEKRVNTITSEQIRANRTVPNVRGGNIAAAGDINVELGYATHGMLLKHLLCPDSYAPVSFASPPVAAVSTAYQIGDYVEDGTTNQIWICIQAGTTAASLTIPTTPAVGDITTQGTAKFQFMGDNDTTPLFQHVFTGGKTLPTGGLSFEKMVVGNAQTFYFQFTGGRVNSFALQVPQDNIVTANFGMLFKDLPQAPTASGFSGTTTPADESPTGYEFYILSKNYGATPYTQNLVAREFSLNIANNFDENIYSFGSRFRKDLIEGRRQITGSMTCYFEDLTDFNAFQNETVKDLQLIFITNGKSLKIHLPEVKFTGGSPTPSVRGPGVISSSYEFQAYMNLAAYDIRMTLTNATTTYA